MANVEEFTIDLATILPNSIGQLCPPGREVSDVYIAEMPAGAPVMLMIGLNAGAGFRGLAQGDSFDCVDRGTCRGEQEGIGVKALAATAGLFRIAVSYGPGAGAGAAARG